MAFLRRKKLRQYVEKFNQEVSVYLEEKGYPLRPKVFVWRVFSYLRVHPELWEEPTWKCLYEECLNYLVSKHIVESDQRESPEELRLVFELVCKLDGENMNRRSFELTEEIVGDYFRYRRRHWFDEKTVFLSMRQRLKKRTHS